jgi:hypothetical protein
MSGFNSTVISPLRTNREATAGDDTTQTESQTDE